MKSRKPIIVMKFGGAALANVENIQKTARIISGSAKDNQLIIVTSALKGITDKLYAIVDMLRSQKLEKALMFIDNLYDYHVKTVYQLDSVAAEVLETQQKIQTHIVLLKLFVKKVQVKKITRSQTDFIVSFGERLSIHVLTQALRQKHLRVIPLDSAYLLTTTKDFGQAKPIEKKQQNTLTRTLLACLRDQAIPVTTGFIGHAPDGCVTTLGRGGSDYTAMYLASLIKANKVILWKDVRGLYDKDPKRYPSAQLISKISYDDANDLSLKGAKVIQPESLFPAKKARIPVLISCFSMPRRPGTLITH